jgi:hypothetical protein
MKDAGMMKASLFTVGCLRGFGRVDHDYSTIATVSQPQELYAVLSVTTFWSFLREFSPLEVCGDENNRAPLLGPYSLVHHLNKMQYCLTSGKVQRRKAERRSGPILSAKLVESRTPKQTTVFAVSVRASESHTFSRNRARSDSSDWIGLQPARFNQRFSGLFLIHNCPPVVER